MKKMPTLFVRNPDDRRHVIPEVTEGCEWVFAGEGTATRKYDGTCVMFDGKGWYARREVKPGKEPPEGWVEVDHDDVTGKRMGWEPIARSSFFQAFSVAKHIGVDYEGTAYEPGTYELCGPKVNGNPEGFPEHTLVRHATAERMGWANNPTIEELWKVLPQMKWEGIVWHHPDGRMAKLKRRDIPTLFGKGGEQ